MKHKTMGTMDWADLLFILKYIFKDILVGILLGLKDSISGIYGIHFHYNKPYRADSKKLPREGNLPRSKIKREVSQSELSSKKEKEFNVRYEIYRCALYNGLGYTASVGVFQIFLYLLRCILTYTFKEETALTVSNYADFFFSSMFDILWIVPLFIMFKVMNVFWFQDIASCAFRHRYGRPQTFPIADQISDNLFSTIIETLFLIQTSLVQFVPINILSLILTCLHLSLLNSLYSFEYLWCNKGWTFHRRISYIESNWPYFVGFGIPLSFITLFLSSMLQSGFVYSVFFPMFIISAIEAPPIHKENPGPPIKIFSFVVWLSSFATKKLVKQDKRGAKVR